MQPQLLIALGFFDGVHLGHQAILKQTVRLAAEHHLRSAALTFESHPRAYAGGIAPPMITTLDGECSPQKTLHAETARRSARILLPPKLAYNAPVLQVMGE